jgi:hypothetical protein
MDAEMIFNKSLASIDEITITIVLIGYLMIFPGARVHGFYVVMSCAF